MNQDRFPIDIERELREFDNNVEFLNDLLDDFFVQVEKRVSMMEKAVLNKDSHVLQIEAHAVKGGAANLSANTLSKAAYDLEDICKKGELDKSVEKVEQIRDEFSILKEYVHNHKSLKL